MLILTSTSSAACTAPYLPTHHLFTGTSGFNFAFERWICVAEFSVLELFYWWCLNSDILHFALFITCPASASNFKDWLTDDKNISNIAPNPDLIKPDKKTCQKEISDTWIGTFRCDRIYQQLPHTPIPVSVWISQSAVIHSFRLPHLYQQFPIPYLSVGLHRCDPVILSNTHSSTQGNGGNYSLTHPLRAMVATYLTLRGIATCLQLPLAQVFWAQQLFLLARLVALHSTVYTPVGRSLSGLVDRSFGLA